MRSHVIMHVRVDDVAHADVRELFSTWLQEDVQRVVVTPNPEFVLLARHDEEFRRILSEAHLALPDGVGLKLAVPSLRRVTGVDALEILYELAEQYGKRLVTIGSSAADVHAGDVVTTLSPDVVTRIAELKPDIIVIGLGQGKQEKVIAAHRHEWPTAKILIGVGGAIDMRAGRQRRAPKFLRSMGLEWLWRLVTEPWRLRRIINAVIVFPILLFREKFL